MSGSIVSSLTSLFMLSDEQAMWRVQQEDDAHAFARLVERWQRPIQNLCTRMLGDSHRAEDLTQEAFARIYGRRKEYQCAGKFSTYLWRVALNLCYDELRRLQRRKELSFDDPAHAFETSLEESAEEEQPAWILEMSERAAVVRRALLQLPEGQRVVLVLRHYEGLKFREIADVLNIPEGTVKSRTADALNAMSRLLQRAGLNDVIPGRRAASGRELPLDAAEKVFVSLPDQSKEAKVCL